MLFNLFLLITVTLSKYIELPLIITEYDTVETILYIGTPPSKYKFHLSSISPDIYITNNVNLYDSMTSSSYTCLIDDYSVPFLENKAKACLSKDTLYLSEGAKFPIKDANFILIYNGDYGKLSKGKIGMEYLSMNETQSQSNSFIDLLYNYNYIDRKQFSLYPFKAIDAVLCRMQIGFDKDDKDMTGFKYKKCSLIQQDQNGNPNSLWQCTLNAVYTNDDIFYTVNRPVTFSIGGNVLCVDINFFNMIYTKYFAAEEETNCRLIKDAPKGSKKVLCHYSFVKKFDKVISFMIGKWNVKLSGEDLWFSDIPGEMTFRLMYYPDKDSVWMINYSSFKDSYRIFFDKVNNEVGFRKQF